MSVFEAYAKGTLMKASILTLLIVTAIQPCMAQTVPMQMVDLSLEIGRLDQEVTDTTLVLIKNNSRIAAADYGDLSATLKIMPELQHLADLIAIRDLSQEASTDDYCGKRIKSLSAKLVKIVTIGLRVAGDNKINGSTSGLMEAASKAEGLFKEAQALLNTITM